MDRSSSVQLYFLMKDESRGVQLLLTGPSSEEHKSQIIWFPPSRRLTACVIAGCVGHAPVHSDSESTPALGGPGTMRALARVVLNSSIQCGWLMSLICTV